MRIFGQKQTNFFKPKEEKKIVAAIKEAELKTSGEIRVHLDEDEVDNIKERAVYIFETLGMKETKDRNGILIYLHPKQKNFLVMGDEGIHKHVGANFWETISKAMKESFKEEKFAEGVIKAISAMGNELKKHYPYNSVDDVNELDDEISYKV